MACTLTTFDIGDKVEIYATFDTATNEEPIEPEVVRALVKTPLSVETTYVYGVDEELQKNPTTGEYYLRFLLTRHGIWFYRWESEDTSDDDRTGAEEARFEVRRSYFTGTILGSPGGNSGALDGGSA